MNHGVAVATDRGDWERVSRGGSRCPWKRVDTIAGSTKVSLTFTRFCGLQYSDLWLFRLLKAIRDIFYGLYKCTNFHDKATYSFFKLLKNMKLHLMLQRHLYQFNYLQGVGFHGFIPLLPLLHVTSYDKATNLSSLF